jgi:hypothetical protein
VGKANTSILWGSEVLAWMILTDETEEAMHGLVAESPDPPTSTE